MRYLSTPIPTNESFLVKWHAWIHAKVARHYKRDRGRILDTAQNVRVRLLSKDFIGRWFFKHLSEELVDRIQAERILGGVRIAYIGHIPQVDVMNLSCLHGKLSVLRFPDSEIEEICSFVGAGGRLRKAPHVGRLGPDELEKLCKDPCVRRVSKGRSCSRMCEHSLWRVSDLLNYANFDYARYFYSVQGHTVDTVKVLGLLGYPPDAFESLASLYRQGRLRPSELTEHECTGRKSCAGCKHGRSLLRRRSLSLVHRWDDPAVRDQVLRLRWNDSQLSSFLRNWRGMNAVFASPTYIMRQPDSNGRVPDVEAGLNAYAEIVLNNEVVNDFKRISRTDDVSRMVFNNGKSPEFSDKETVAFDGEDDEERPNQVFRDTGALDGFKDFEHRTDVQTLIDQAGLTDEERKAMMAVELMEMTVRQYSEATNIPVPRVHRIRASAWRKLRGGDVPVDEVVDAACERHGCSPSDLSGPAVVGPSVLARTEVFSELHDLGMSVESISEHFNYSESRVVAAINRRILRDMRST